MRMEVLPYALDAWYVPGSVKVGYEISFTREFYRPQPLRPLEEIRADILAVERETEGLLGEIIGDSRRVRAYASPSVIWLPRQLLGHFPCVDSLKIAIIAEIRPEMK